MVDLMKTNGPEVRHLLLLCTPDSESSISQTTLEDYSDSPVHHLYKYQLSEQIVGVIGLRILGPGEGEILHVAVDTQYRKQGIGRALIQSAIHTLSLVRLEAEANWNSAYFFRSCGFRVWSLGLPEEENESNEETLKCVWVI